MTKSIYIRIDRKLFKGIALAVLSLVITWGTVKLCPILGTDGYMSWIWIAALCLFFSLDISNIRCSQLTKIIIGAGTFGRIAMALISVYGKGVIANILNFGDQIGFVNIANDFYSGQRYWYGSIFPDMMVAIYKVFGPNRIMVQIIGIFLWYMGLKILEEVGSNYVGKKKQYLVIMYCIMPFHMMITEGVWREGYMSFFLMLSGYYLMMWMNAGKKLNLILSILAMVPAILMHGGNIAMLGVIYYTYFMWDTKKKKWRNLGAVETIVLIAVALFGTLVLWNTLLRSSGLNYVNARDGFSLERLQYRVNAYVPGRTDYIPEYMNVTTNIFKFMMYTVYRAVYFWISPTPRIWGSMVDVVSFVTDSIPWILLFFGYIKDKKTKKYVPEGKILLIAFLLFTFIYCWGTRNSGTAMRHRDLMLGLFILFRLHSINREQRNESNENSVLYPIA